MSNAEIVEWLMLLASTNIKRRAIIWDFFTCGSEAISHKLNRSCASIQPPKRCSHRYAELSSEDAEIALRALQIMERQHVPEYAEPIKLTIPDDYDNGLG